MKRSQRWNNLQICPRRNSNTGGSDLWSNTLPLDHGATPIGYRIHNIMATNMARQIFQPLLDVCLFDFYRENRFTFIILFFIKFTCTSVLHNIHPNSKACWFPRPIITCIIQIFGYLWSKTNVKINSHEAFWIHTTRYVYVWWQVFRPYDWLICDSSI